MSSGSRLAPLRIVALLPFDREEAIDIDGLIEAEPARLPITG
jgi:hypothetical protein